MLRLRRAEQQQRLLKEQERLDRVEALLQLIHQENTVNTDAVITKDTAAQRFASIRKTIPAYNQIGQLFAALFRVLPGSATRGPCFAIWHDDEHKDQDVDAEACVPVDEKYQGLPTVRCADLPTVKVASVIHHGAYNTLSRGKQAKDKAVLVIKIPQIGGQSQTVFGISIFVPENSCCNGQQTASAHPSV